MSPLERVILLGQGFAVGVEDDDQQYNAKSDPAAELAGETPERSRLPAVDRNIASLRHLLHSRRFMLPASAVDVPVDLSTGDVTKLVRKRLLPDSGPPPSSILLYFAGHAVARGKELYLLLDEKADFKWPEDFGLPVSTLLELVAKSQVALRVIILDCCNAAHGYMTC